MNLLILCLTIWSASWRGTSLEKPAETDRRPMPFYGRLWRRIGLCGSGFTTETMIHRRHGNGNERIRWNRENLLKGKNKCQYI